MRTYFFWSLFIIGFSLPAMGQLPCSSYDYQQSLLQRNLLSRIDINELENFIQQTLNSDTRVDGNEGQRLPLITIPVVVHVLYNNASQNITDQQVFNQIKILNECFRRRQADTVNTPARFAEMAADCDIEFKLAISDPAKRSTTGILRKYTPVSRWESDDKVKFSAEAGDDAWDSRYYLNIWVCNLNRSMGYASFPAGDPSKDGIVLSTGAFSSNETIVHETGHWLGLKHIWGEEYCGDDLVADTPPQSTFTSGCPTGVRPSCNNGPSGDMYMNYMDITSDACTNLFTQGQKGRMRSLFASGGPRFGLLSSTGLSTPLVSSIPVSEEIPKWYFANIYPNPALGELTIDVSYDIRWVGKVLNISSAQGQMMMQAKINSKIMRLDVSRLKPGIYFITAKKEDGSEIKQKLVKM
jgi:hypothetical protein